MDLTELDQLTPNYPRLKAEAESWSWRKERRLEKRLKNAEKARQAIKSNKKVARFSKGKKPESPLKDRYSIRISK